jgi:hypothetical protein
VGDNGMPGFMVCGNSASVKHGLSLIFRGVKVDCRKIAQ